MLQKLLTALLVFSLAQVGGARGNKDPRTQPITRQQLQQAVAKAPLSASRIQGRLIARAYSSKLIGAAYMQYTKIWQKQPNNAYANYWRGSTAFSYWWVASYPSEGIHLTGEEKMRLFETARSCLSKAVELNPNFAPANASYGVLLFDHQHEEVKGLQLIRRAVVLDPKSSGAWQTLGEALINPYRSAYNPKEAEKALLTAARLDPLFSAPHYALTRLYVDQKRFKEAQRELRAFVSLVPQKDAASTIAFFKPTIDKGLRR